MKLYRKKFGEKLLDYRETGRETAGIHVLMVTQHIPESPIFHLLQGYLQEHLTYDETGGSLAMPCVSDPITSSHR